jgi:hypothetical protein
MYPYHAHQTGRKNKNKTINPHTRVVQIEAMGALGPCFDDVCLFSNSVY